MKVDLVTVTCGTWETYTERLIRMLSYFTEPDEIECWIICDNDSSDAARLRACHNSWASLSIVPVYAVENIGDLPRYNRLLRDVCTSPLVICISTDCRVFGDDWVRKFVAPFERDASIAMVGYPGPGHNMGPAHADPQIGGVWHWIPKLLADRGIPFDTCEHVQTHCFAVRRDAFLDVGGFWTPEADFLNKGHLIAGEIAMGVKLRQAGYKLSYEPPHVYHYGNAAQSAEALDSFDRVAGWSIPWQ